MCVAVIAPMIYSLAAFGVWSVGEASACNRVLCIAGPLLPKRLFCSANSAQQLHNVAIFIVGVPYSGVAASVPDDGAFERRLAATAGRRVRGKRENWRIMQQNQRRHIVNMKAHLFFAFKSALPAIRDWHN